MGATLAITAATLVRLRGGSLPDSGLLLLVAGFIALPLLPYSHTLYPETFMALGVAALTLCTVVHFQATVPSRRTAAALSAISICGISIGLHPKYFVVLLGVTAYFALLELSDRSKSDTRTRFKVALGYIAMAGVWLAMFSWFHSIMWEEFHPAGWFKNLPGTLGVSPRRAIVQLLDLFFGRELGLFILTPLTLLAIASLVVALLPISTRIERRLGLLVLLLVGLIAGPAAFSVDWHAGDSPLGRYVAPLVPVLLLIGVHVTLRKPWSIGQRVFLAVVVGLGVVQSLTYAALPMSFRPELDGGSGAIDVISDRIAGLATIESWLWAPDEPWSWAGVAIWIVILAVTLWLFARPDNTRSPETSEPNTERFEPFPPSSYQPDLADG
jgi:hypothetical protein